MRNALKSLLADNFPQIAAEVLDPLVRFLQLARALCGGDADKFLVLTVIALRTTQHPEFRAVKPADPTWDEGAILPSLGVNVRSVAESLGIPKETVRRKVQELVAAGWIAREGAGLHITGLAYRDLAPVREELEALVARYYVLGAQLLPRA